MTDVFYRRNLPHYHPPEATYFVTFRLAGSLPRQFLERLRQEYEQEERLLKQHFQGQSLNKERYRLQKKIFARYDAVLDKAANGPRWLADPCLAHIVAREIHALHPTYYTLLAYCIMSNHVHLLVDTQGIPEPPRPASGQHCTPLNHALRLLKGRTARFCNEALGRSGSFWTPESYDHVVRDGKELERIVAYIINNPVKAGLVENADDWAFTYCAM
ncbi:MAG: transposase [Anaerolineae bacterium]|nr:transposase [Anaerolineae bacterium]